MPSARRQQRSAHPFGEAGRRGHNNSSIERLPSNPPLARRRRRAALALSVSLGAALAIALALVLTRHSTRIPPPLTVPAAIAVPDPLTFDRDRALAYEQAAAFGLSHALFAKSPGGVLATAKRTAVYRPLVEHAVSGTGIDANLVEAIIFLESAGRPDVIAGDDPANAAGLTQILAGTATDFLGMPVDLHASRTLTREIDRSLQRGNAQAVARLEARRRAVDARFDPAQAIAGTVRYLTTALKQFGREDLAVVSYHMGIGNLESVLRSYAGEPSRSIADVVREHDLSYARIYFDSSPASHRDAWERLASFGDDSQTYYWRVLAARDIMRLYRQNPLRLARLATLHGHGPSAELVLQPTSTAHHFATPAELEAGFKSGILRALPNDPQLLHYRVDPRLRRLVSGLGADPTAYRTLRPRALRLLGYLAQEVYKLSKESRPLTVTRAAYDEASGATLTPSDVEPRGGQSSVHATGFAFDVRRRYGSGAQAESFQWTLERLEALGLIAWTRGKSVIHIVVSPQADARPVR